MNKEEEVLKLKQRISELTGRLKNPKNWASGEVRMFEQEIKVCLDKLKELTTDIY